MPHSWNCLDEHSYCNRMQGVDRMKKNPLLDLESFGQSIWLDYLRRNALENGEFKHWIEQDGATGLTSNPSIFEKAIAESHDYDNAIRAMALDGKSIEEIYQGLT